MNTPSNPTGIPPRRPWFNRMTFVAFVAGAALAGSVVALASASGMDGWHHGMMMNGTPTAAQVSAHVEHMLKHLYVEIDATEAQKAQIEPLVKQAVNDLLPLHAQLQASHAQAIEGLTQPTIDRAALEAARTTHVQLFDQSSKRIVQLIADIGDVLTPAQRSALVSHLKQMHGMSDP
jgi:periplasmic protein CpxP/Spy